MVACRPAYPIYLFTAFSNMCWEPTRASLLDDREMLTIAAAQTDLRRCATVTSSG